MKNTAFMMLGILVAFAVVFFVAHGSQKNEVSVQYTSDNLANAVLIDVREPAELKNDGYIAGAVNIPLGAIPSSLNKIPKDKPVIVYCRSGHRSANAVKELQELGYTNVKSMAGGITAWKGAGFPVK